MRNVIVSFCLFLAANTAFAQQRKPVAGFVVDTDSKIRLSRVYLYNPGADEGVFNNLKGEFYINAKPGDTICAAVNGYAMDTLIYHGQNALVVQLKSLAIRLKEVNIIGKKPTPQEEYQQNLEAYKTKIALGSTKDMLNVGPTGVGLGIDAVYNLISKDGKNARRLSAVLEKDYREAIIDYRFKPDYVKSIIPIKNANLADFMAQYRPTYNFVLTANEYEFVAFVKNSYASYKRNPKLLRLPSLPDSTFKP